MPNLSEQDHQKILLFLQGLYTHQCFEDFADYIREGILQIVPAELSVFSTANFETCQIIGRGPIPYIPDIDEVIKYHFHKDPFTRHYLKTADFSAYKLSDFLTEEQLHQSEFLYHRFLRYISGEENMVLGLPYTSTNTSKDLYRTGIVIDSINLFRKERSFTERDRVVLNLLQPHLIQARHIACSFSQLVNHQKTLESSLNASGSIIISKEGYIQWIAPQAERFLKQYFPDFNYFSRRLPERLGQWFHYQQSLLLKYNGDLRPLSSLNIEQGNQILNVHFTADLVKDQYTLLLSEQKQQSLSIELLETLGLSTRETEVLLGVIEGKTNAEIASTLHLSISTVRKHLEHIYPKLGAHTRAGVVVKALKLLGTINLESITSL